jgi:tRNA(adenine34) deaminase
MHSPALRSSEELGGNCQVEPFSSLDHEKYMREALLEAEKAFERGDRPIGAVIVHDGKVIARGSNEFFSRRSYISHAELNALISAAPFLYDHGRECVIYTTVEPCVMCLGAIVQANIRNIGFGMPDNYIRARKLIDAVEYVDRRVHNYLGGILEKECIELYRRYSEREAQLMLTGLREPR